MSVTEPIFPESDLVKLLDQVVDNYRQEMGYTKLHITYGPKATPENIIAELRNYEQKHKKYDDIPEVDQLKMKLEDAYERIKEIGKLAQSKVTDIVDGIQHPDVTELKHKIFKLTELYTAVPIDDHIRRYFGADNKE